MTPQYTNIQPTFDNDGHFPFENKVTERSITVTPNERGTATVPAAKIPFPIFE